jgi:hypothetical protein
MENPGQFPLQNIVSHTQFRSQHPGMQIANNTIMMRGEPFSDLAKKIDELKPTK